MLTFHAAFMYGQWLLREMGGSRVPLILEIGRWWGNGPERREQDEIDIVVLCDEGALFAECKWREQLTDTDVLETLEHRSRLVPAGKRTLFVFSKSGFVEACRARAEAIGAALASLGEMGIGRR